MSNMSYCRFQNTYQDLVDCYEALNDDEDLSEVEKNYRQKLIKLAAIIAAEYADKADEA